MSNGGPPEQAVLDQAFQKMTQNQDKVVQLFNQLVERANTFMQYAPIVSPGLGGLAVWWVSRNMKEIRAALQRLFEIVKIAVERHVPVISLIITSFDWIHDVKTPVSELVATSTGRGRGPENFDFEKWEGQARSAYDRKVSIQSDALSELQSRADFISGWLYEVVKSNVGWAVKMVDILSSLVGPLTSAVANAATVVNAPFAIDDVADLIATAIEAGIAALTALVERAVEIIGQFRDLASIVSDHSKLPGGAWPEAVRG
jgi:phage-related protein